MPSRHVAGVATGTADRPAQGTRRVLHWHVPAKLSPQVPFGSPTPSLKQVSPDGQSLSHPHAVEVTVQQPLPAMPVPPTQVPTVQSLCVAHDMPELHATGQASDEDAGNVTLHG